MCLGVRAREFVFGHSKSRTHFHSLLVLLIFGLSGGEKTARRGGHESFCDL
jgi:hypothetical protein